MLRWLKLRWAKAKEIARLHEESRRLRGEIERLTGEPVKLNEQERAELAHASRGLDRKTLDRLSALGTDAVLPSDSGKEGGSTTRE